MPLGREVGVGTGDIMLDGDPPPPLPPQKKKRGTTATPLLFGPPMSIVAKRLHGWIKVPLGSEVGLGPGLIVLDGDQLPPLQKGGTAQPPFSVHIYCT